MKKIYLLALMLPTIALAQTSPSVGRTDMPVPLDTLRQSTAAPVLPASVPPLTRRGANQTWNYAALVATAQNVARFTAVPAQPLYLLTFGSLFSGSNRATVAAPQALPLPPGLPLPLTDPYEFYNASAADFRSVGYGAALAGTAVPVTYAANQQDIIYRLPLRFGNARDSSSSFFSISVPGTGYLSQKRKRVNTVDGWGTLTTPFGTFQAVRVVARLNDYDSVAVTGLNQRFAVPTRREYKWLAVGQHVPLLTITTTVVAGQEVVSNVQYRDIYRRIVRTATRDAALDAALALYPNPLAAGAALRLDVPADSGPLTVTATDLLGRTLLRRSFAAGGRLVLEAGAFGGFRGVAVLTVASARGAAVRRLVRE